MSPDLDFSATLTGPPPRVFPNAGMLVLPGMWLVWLEAHPDGAKLLQSAYRCLVRLSWHTGWSEERALERLGCGTQSADEIREFPKEQMRQCGLFFEWVETLVLELDLPSDKRLLVSGAARFFTAAEKDLDTCKEVMHTGPFSPLEYLRLGEIAESWQSAIRLLPGARGERARQTWATNPFVDQSTPHVGLKRMEMLALPDAEALFGPRIEKRVRKHLRDCGACGEAYNRRIGRLSQKRSGSLAPA